MVKIDSFFLAFAYLLVKIANNVEIFLMKLYKIIPNQLTKHGNCAILIAVDFPGSSRRRKDTGCPLATALFSGTKRMRKEGEKWK